MTTIKSSSEKTGFLSVYRSALKHQTHFAIIITIILVLLVPLLFFVSLESPSRMGLSGTAEIRDYLARSNLFNTGVYMGQSQAGVVTCTLMLFSLVIALVQNAYLHSKKMTDLYHSLPVKRPHLMGANMLSSMTVILGPYLVVTLATVVMQLVTYGRYMPDMGRYFTYIGLDVFCSVVTVAAIYMFTTLVAVNVGTVFDTFALTGVIGMTPLAVLTVCRGIWTVLTYGSYYGLRWVLSISPLTFGMQRYMTLSYTDFSKEALYREQVGRVMALNGVWLLVTCAMFVLAVVCYNRRKSEVAEQTQPSGVLQTAAKCVGGFLGGALLFAIFYHTGSVVVWVVAILAGAVLLGLIAELILSRGVRSLKKNFKWLLASGGLCLLVLLVSHFDLMGYTTKVPAADQVASVQISYRGRFEALSPRDYSGLDEYGYLSFRYVETLLEDPSAIGIVVDAHAKAVADQPPRDYEWEDDETYKRYPYQYLTLAYQMKDGSVMERNYTRLNIDAVLALTGLEGEPEFARQNHMLFYGNNNTTAYNGVRGVTLYNGLGGDGTQLKLNGDDTQRLLEAARLDIAAETAADVAMPAKRPLAYLEIAYQLNQDYEVNSLTYCHVIVSEYYANTLAVLRELGVEDLLGVPEVQPDEVLLVPVNYVIGTESSVLANVPGNGSHLRPNPQTYEYYQEAYPVMEDAATIRGALDAGRAQMLVRRDGPIGCTVMMAVFYEDGDYVGTMLVAWDDLTAEAQQELIRWDERGYGDYTFIPEEVLEEITVEVSDDAFDGEEESVSVRSSVEGGQE